MSDLHTVADDYLALRRAMGFKLTRTPGLLHGFIDYLEANHASVITTELAMDWATLPDQASSWWWRQRLGVVRGFARYCYGIDEAHAVPPAGLIHAVAPRATPYLFSDADVVALLAAAEQLDPPFRSRTYQSLIGVLAVTGMRVSEAITLDDGDVDLEEGVIVVRDTKFEKTRELALHPSTVDVLRGYRQDRVGRPRPVSDAFFVSTVGTRLHYPNVWAVFQRLTATAGLQERRRGGRPRLHDLRHSFAVRTVVGWYADGLDAGPRFAALSTYLGHTRPAGTYWYLSATPELLGLAAERLELSVGVRP